MNRVSLSSSGFYSTPKIRFDNKKFHGRPFLYFCYGAAVSEVMIDTLTGENKILRVDILHDAGRAINPAIEIGQIEGGFLQGSVSRLHIAPLTAAQAFDDIAADFHDGVKRVGLTAALNARANR